MADRSERIRIFESTMTLCETNATLHRAVRASLDRQIIYWADETLPPIPEKRYARTQLLLVPDRTCEAAKAYPDKRVCILNFASFVSPGGGVTKGASAQEESICRISTLYKCIGSDRARIYYDSHWDKIRSGRSNRGNNDDIIFTPGVTVCKADTFDCEPLPETEWYTMDVITCAAPDLRYVPDGQTFSPSDEELRLIHEQRWRRIFDVAALHGAEILIVGAFGCGAFRNPPQIVAKAAEAVCAAYDGQFEKIVFAIFTQTFESENYRAFSVIPGIRRETNV